MNADDPKFTAHVLGESEDLTPAERAAIEALIASDPAAATQAAETQALAAKLRAELQGEAAPALDEAQRAAVLHAAQEGGGKRVLRFRRPSRALLAVAACLAVSVSAALLLFPEIRESRKMPDASKAMPELAQKTAESAPISEALGKVIPQPVATPSIDGGQTIAMNTVSAPSRAPQLSGGAVAGAAPASSKDEIITKDVAPAPLEKGAETTKFASAGDIDSIAVPVAPSALPAARAAHAASPFAGRVAVGPLADHPWVAVRDTPVSIVDFIPGTGSYDALRRSLNQHQRPPTEAVQIAELLNHFALDRPEQGGDETLAATSEVASCPWAPDHRLVRIALQAGKTARDVKLQVEFNPAEVEEYRLIGSEHQPASPSRDPKGRSHPVVLDAGRSLTLLYELAPTHRPNGAYAALDNLEPTTTTRNRVNRAGKRGPATGPSSTAADAAPTAGVSVGLTQALPATPETITKAPQEVYAKKAVAPQFKARETPQPPVAKMLPGNAPAPTAAVPAIPPPAGGGQAYLAQKDLNPLPNAPLPGTATAGKPSVEKAVPVAVAATPPALGVEILTLRLHYKTAEGDTIQPLEIPLRDTGMVWEDSSPDFRFAAAVAGFGMLLRDSPDRGQATWESVAAWARQGLGSDLDGPRKEFLELVEKAKDLDR